MLQTDSGIRNLAPIRGSAQLPHQLGDLCHARRADGMSLRQQTTRRVDHDFTAIGVVLVQNHACRAAFGLETQGFVAHELIGREAVVQLRHIDVLGSQAGTFVGDVGRAT